MKGTSYRSGMRYLSRKINTLSASQHLSFLPSSFFCLSSSSLSLFRSFHHSLSVLFCLLCCSFCFPLITLSCFISSPISFITPLPPLSSLSLCFPFFCCPPPCVTLVLCCSSFIHCKFSYFTLCFYTCPFFQLVSFVIPFGPKAHFQAILSSL